MSAQTARKRKRRWQAAHPEWREQAREYRREQRRRERQLTPDLAAWVGLLVWELARGRR